MNDSLVEGIDEGMVKLIDKPLNDLMNYGMVDQWLNG